jgi:hypothetical protein
MPYDIIIGRDEADKIRFGTDGLIYIGKGFVKMGMTSSLSNRILMDVARSHVVLVCGKRGSGKSYSLGVIAEEMASLPEEIGQNIATLIFDTMGIFWTMTYANEKEQELLKSWNIQPKKLPVRIFAPLGFANEYRDMGIPITKGFAFKATELSMEEGI